MSFDLVLQEQVLAALRAATEIASTANGVFLERPVRASVPYLVLGPLVVADWSVKDAAGREVRIAVQVHDAGESWTRTVQLQGAAARALQALPREIEGWRLGSVTMLRSRTARDGTTGWVGLVEYRVRAMEIG